MIYTIEYQRKMTFENLKHYGKKYKEVKEILYKSGFYYHIINDIIQCCMKCSTYTTNFIKTIHELYDNNNNNNNNDNFINKILKIYHKENCLFMRPYARSKIFYNYYQSFLYERERLNSFIEFPIPHKISPQILAKIGFYYDRTSDVCICIFCKTRQRTGNVINNDVYILLSKCLDTCPLKIKEYYRLHTDIFTCNISLAMSNILDNMVTIDDNFPIPGMNNNNNNNKKKNVKEIGLHILQDAMYKKYVSEEKRYDSFKYWNTIRKYHKPEELSKAGFFFYW